jgi:hypothetical protein
MNNAWVVVEKADIPEDLSRRTDKGKSSHVSFAENPVTLHETADRSDTVIKAPPETTKGQQVPIVVTKAQHIPGKSTKKAVLELSMTEVWLTIEPHNNKQPTGCQELQTKMTM